MTVKPDSFLTGSVSQLEKSVSDRDQSIKTLTASVLITAAVGGGTTGKVTTYTSFKGYIFVRKPNDLRVILQLPILGSRAMDMVSNGESFKLVHATAGHGDVWIEGPNKVSTPSKNALENLRPPVFFDSLLVPGVAPDEFVNLTESTRILPSPDKKRTDIEEPDYDMTVSRGTGKVLHTERVIHISRLNLLPYQQDIYDEQGSPVTIATYDKYQKFEGVDFPTIINISRPQDGYSLKVQITKATLNEQLEDDQFELPIPPNVQVQEMK